MRSPISWYGGKGRVVKKILPYFPEHTCYVEPFCGSAALLFAKKPSKIEVINDIEGEVIHFFRVLQDKVQAEELIRRLAVTPYSREEYELSWIPTEDPIERARRFFIRSRQSFLASACTMRYHSPGSWGFEKRAQFGCSRAVKFLRAVDGLPRVVNRLRRVSTESLDFEAILEKYDAPEGTTFFYCDPPYMLGGSSRTGWDRYKYEFAKDDHERLARALNRINGKVLVSYYEEPEILDLYPEPGWRYRRFKTTKFGGIGKGAKGATELLLANYPFEEDLFSRGTEAAA